MSTATGSNNTGHGHVYPRPDGVRARCGGPAMCVECSGDYVRQNSREAKHPMTDIDAIRKRDAEFALDLISPHPWQMATSCSFRRVIDAQGREIIGGTVQHSDGHPDMYFANRGYQGPDATLLIEAPQIAADRRALRIAYDAKCEELRGMALLKERMWQSESECVELRHHVARLGAKVSALDASLGTVIAERDAAHREKAAAMGLVEGHALTIAKLEAERDAAVRDAQRYRWLRNRGYIAGINGRPFCVYDGKAYRYGYELDDAIDAQLAALAPPTEQTTEQTKVAP